MAWLSHACQTPDVDFDPVDPGKLRDPALEVGDDNALKAAVEVRDYAILD